MAYNIAANQRLGNPVGAFLGARDNAMQNNLLRRQADEQSQQQQFAQQNTLFQQNRLTQQDQAEAKAQQEAAARAQEVEHLKQGYAGAQRILAAPEGQRVATAASVFDAEDVQSLAEDGIYLDQLDESGALQLAQHMEGRIGKALGIAPPAPPKAPEPFTLGPGQQRFGPDGKPIASVAPNPSKGMRFQSDGAGGFSLYEGPDAQGIDLTGPSRNKIQEGAINAQSGIDRLSGIRAGFDPRWLTYKGQFSQYMNAIKDKAKGMPGVSNLTPQEQSDLSSFARFKSDTTDNLNRYITEITGAAMGVEEAKRIISTMPSLEDGPQAFQTKLDRVEERLKLVLARSVYTMRNGIKFDAIPIDQMKSIMNKRGDALYQENLAKLRNPQAARQATIEGLHSEFYQ